MEIATTWTPAAYDRTAAHWQLTPSEVGDGSKGPFSPPDPPGPLAPSPGYRRQCSPFSAPPR